MATNLNGMGIDTKTVQLVLRYANMKTTEDCYIKGIPVKVTEGMKRYSEHVDQFETQFRASFRPSDDEEAEVSGNRSSC